MQRAKNFSGPASKKSDCWLSFAIKWDFIFFSVVSKLQGPLGSLCLLTGALSLAADISFPSLSQALQNKAPTMMSVLFSELEEPVKWSDSQREEASLARVPKSLWPVSHLQGDHSTVSHKNLTDIYNMCFCTKYIWFHYFRPQLPHRILFLSSTTWKKFYLRTFQKTTSVQAWSHHTLYVEVAQVWMIFAPWRIPHMELLLDKAQCNSICSLVSISWSVSDSSLISALSQKNCVTKLDTC